MNLAISKMKTIFTILFLIAIAMEGTRGERDRIPEVIRDIINEVPINMEATFFDQEADGTCRDDPDEVMSVEDAWKSGEFFSCDGQDFICKCVALSFNNYTSYTNLCGQCERAIRPVGPHLDGFQRLEMFIQFMQFINDKDINDLKAPFIMHSPNMNYRRMFLEALVRSIMETFHRVPEELKAKLLKALIGNYLDELIPSQRLSGEEGGDLPHGQRTNRDPVEFIKKLVPALVESFNCDAVNPESEEFQTKMEAAIGSVALEVSHLDS